MGFGYLAIGYLVTFVLYLPAQALDVGGLALLIGYGSMLLGLSRLNRFELRFVYAKWLLIPLIVTALYDCARPLSELFLLNLPIFQASVIGVVDWIKFILLILFNFFMLYAIRALAEQVELPRTVMASIRNLVFVALYAVLYLIGNLPIENIKTVQGYLIFPVTLLQMVWIACNLILLVSCAKNICAEGNEEIEPKRYRWEWINRIGDAYESNRQRSIDRLRQETEEKLQKRKEAREKKKIQHGKKK